MVVALHFWSIKVNTVNNEFQGFASKIVLFSYKYKWSYEFHISSVAYKKKPDSCGKKSISETRD